MSVIYSEEYCLTYVISLAALMLGHLRMTVDEAINALLSIVGVVFDSDLDAEASSESNMKMIRAAIEDMLRTRNIQTDTMMHDKRLQPVKCKVCVSFQCDIFSQLTFN
jgi:hypothetical protein